MESKLLKTYNPMPYSFESGDGVWLFDAKGNKYLDALSGIAVTGLGHKHPAVTKAIKEQSDKIIHASNVVTIPNQIDFANLLANNFNFDAKVFFGNSGAEAVEAAIKLARLYGHSRNIEVPKIVVATGAFHGRTMGALTACASDKIKKDFLPMLEGFVRVEYNNVDSLASLEHDSDICAMLLEPIQGESGIRVPDSGYLAKVREICDNNNWLLIVDEIQAGMGRTGKLWAHLHEDIEPDAITLAKGLANGVPIGAIVVKEPHASLFKPGSHGSTFGGNPLSCAAGIATLETILQEKLWENAKVQGERLLNGLRAKLDDKAIVGIRGKGLMLGIELDHPCRDTLKMLFAAGLICNVAADRVIRLLPPLITNAQQVDRIIDIIADVLPKYLSSR